MVSAMAANSSRHVITWEKYQLHGHIATPQNAAESRQHAAELQVANASR
jgi:hypothetical protein